jgi:hypothetical protein
MCRFAIPYTKMSYYIPDMPCRVVVVGNTFWIDARERQLCLSPCHIEQLHHELAFFLNIRVHGIFLSYT